MKISKQDVCFIILLLTAVYFAAISGVWTYLINIFIGIPIFLLSYLFWKTGRKNDFKTKRYKYIIYLWYSGIGIACLSLIGYLIFN